MESGPPLSVDPTSVWSVQSTRVWFIGRSATLDAIRPVRDEIEGRVRKLMHEVGVAPADEG